MTPATLSFYAKKKVFRSPSPYTSVSDDTFNVALDNIRNTTYQIVAQIAFRHQIPFLNFQNDIRENRVCSIFGTGTD